MESRSQDPTAPGATAPGAAQADTSNGDSAQADQDQQTPGEVFHAAQRNIAQLGEYVSHFISAKLDAMRLAARHAVFFALCGIIAGIAAIALVVTAVVYLVRGIAETLTAIFGGHAWAGDLVTALLLLGTIAGSLLITFRRSAKTSRERTVKKYAAKQQQQRARFGEDVSDSRPPV